MSSSQTPAPAQNWSLPPGNSQFAPALLEEATVAGTVTDAQTEAALDGAAVKLVGPTPSDWRGSYARGGQFEFNHLPKGTYFVEAAQDGYSSDGRWVNVLADSRAQVTMTLERGSDCAFNVANDTPWRLEVSVAGFRYSPFEVGPFAGTVFPGNTHGPTQISAEASFVDHPPLNWGPFTFGCNGLQTVPLEPPPSEPIPYPAEAGPPPGPYSPPVSTPSDYGPPPAFDSPPG